MAVSIAKRLIVGLDVDSLAAARRVVERLVPVVSFFKIGKQLFVNAGPDAVRMVRSFGCDVFLDLKFHDIPNTVAQAGAEAVRLGVRFFNVHASGGATMMATAGAEARRVARAERHPVPAILGVTVLTSIGPRDLAQVGVAGSPARQVLRLARLAERAGLDGVVASPLEVARLRKACGPKFLIVTPGVRPAGVDHQDQKRVMTPAAAMAAGADYLVVSRPVLAAPDPVQAARDILAEMRRGVSARAAGDRGTAARGGRGRDR